MHKTHLLLTAALAGLLTGGVSAVAGAEDIRCYGIAKAGQNACASASGSHGCKGEAKVDNDPGEFLLASAEDCGKQGGKIEAPAAK